MDPALLKRRFLVRTWGFIFWVLIIIVSFVLLGSISYISLGALLSLLALMFVFEHKQVSNSKLLLPILLALITIITHLPLIYPGFVTIEKDGLYVSYSDGSHGYIEVGGQQFTTTYPPVKKGQKFFITGYSYDERFLAGTKRKVFTTIGPFNFNHVKRSNITLSVPSVLTNVFFTIQRSLNTILWPITFL